MNRNTLARTFQTVEEVDRFFILEDVNLTALVVSNPVIGRSNPVPTQGNDQDTSGSGSKSHSICSNDNWWVFVTLRVLPSART